MIPTYHHKAELVPLNIVDNILTHHVLKKHYIITGRKDLKVAIIQNGVIQFCKVGNLSYLVLLNSTVMIIVSIAQCYLGSYAGGHQRL